VANATATQKEKSTTTPTGGVPDLALMLTGDNTVTQAKELLPPQHDAAFASKKNADERMHHLSKPQVGLGLLKSAQHYLLILSGYSPEWYQT